MKRPKNQIWMASLHETPMSCGSTLGKYGHLFNWTASFRPDSTFAFPYYKWSYYDDDVKVEKQSINYAKGKTHQVAWFISHCQTQTKTRFKYARELQKYISVDIYGSCGNLTCPKNTKNICFEILRTKYKFYLAFENSNCRHYITEKFFKNALMNNVIPIVMGAKRQDYERSAPYKSFIHVDDFESARHLADYLHKLDKDDDLYNEFFAWKGTGEFLRMPPHLDCRVCALLHAPDIFEHTSIFDYSNFFNRDVICVQ